MTLKKKLMERVLWEWDNLEINVWEDFFVVVVPRIKQFGGGAAQEE